MLKISAITVNIWPVLLYELRAADHMNRSGQFEGITYGVLDSYRK
jgi:hypothetical protein